MSDSVPRREAFSDWRADVIDNHRWEATQSAEDWASDDGEYTGMTRSDWHDPIAVGEWQRVDMRYLSWRYPFEFNRRMSHHGIFSICMIYIVFLTLLRVCWGVFCFL